MKLAGDRCQCAGHPYRGCGEYFNSTRAFDKHRTGEYSSRRCLSQAEMRAIGMAQNAAGFWVTELHSGSILWRTRTAGDQSDPLPESLPADAPAELAFAAEVSP